MPAQRLDAHPEVGDIAAVETPFGDRRIIDRFAAHHGQRIGFRGGKKTRHVIRIVLPVGVDLQRVGKASLKSGSEPNQATSPLPLVEPASVTT